MSVVEVEEAATPGAISLILMNLEPIKSGMLHCTIGAGIYDAKDKERDYVRIVNRL